MEKGPQPKKEKATDMEIALFLSRHINEPCKDLHENNLRDSYIRESRRTLETMQEPEAKRLLETVIRKYSE